MWAIVRAGHDCFWRHPTHRPYRLVLQYGFDNVPVLVWGLLEHLVVRRHTGNPILLAELPLESQRLVPVGNLAQHYRLDELIVVAPQRHQRAGLDIYAIACAWARAQVYIYESSSGRGGGLRFFDFLDFLDALVSRTISGTSSL